MTTQRLGAKTATPVLPTPLYVPASADTRAAIPRDRTNPSNTTYNYTYINYCSNYNYYCGLLVRLTFGFTYHIIYTDTDNYHLMLLPVSYTHLTLPTILRV